MQVFLWKLLVWCSFKTIFVICIQKLIPYNLILRVVIKNKSFVQFRTLQLLTYVPLSYLFYLFRKCLTYPDFEQRCHFIYFFNIIVKTDGTLRRELILAYSEYLCIITKNWKINKNAFDGEKIQFKILN